MRNLLDRYLFTIPRNAEGGAGGDGGAGAAAPGDGAAGDGTTPPAADAGAAADGSNGGDGNGTPAEVYFPEGLAENLKGTNDRETIDKITGALKGYRDRDAAADRPETAEGYFSLEGVDAKAFTLDDRFKAHFDGFANDPGMKAAAAVAQKHGIPRPAFLEALQASMAGLSEAGLLEPMVDTETERAALLPAEAKSLPKDQQDAAIERRMTDNLAFVDLMVTNKGLPKEAGEYAQLMLADTAKGHQFLEWVRNTVQGGGGGPGGHGQGGGGNADTAETLRAEMAKPELTAGHPMFDKAKYAAFDSRYKAFHAKPKS